MRSARDCSGPGHVRARRVFAEGGASIGCRAKRSQVPGRSQLLGLTKVSLRSRTLQLSSHGLDRESTQSRNDELFGSTGTYMDVMMSALLTPCSDWLRVGHKPEPAPREIPIQL